MKPLQIATELTTQDLKELGFKSGIEIHQQLEGEKLFCTCPTTIRDDVADFHIQRTLRASAGEGGLIDKAASAEQEKKKTFLYQGYTDTTCLVELDEEPPHDPNPQALQSALQMAKLLKMHIVHQLRFMRKTVVDGSNTSGFQRTGLIATNGTLKTPQGRAIGIESLCLEEDSAKHIQDSSRQRTYNLSRLGIPLIEIATAPDLKTPQEIQEVASQLGMMLRSLEYVKRGLGTIRQDVNISIQKGVRVEIKGAQDLKTIPLLGEYEALRQHNLLHIFKELQQRQAQVSFDIQEITSLQKTTSKVIRQALDKKKGVVLGAKLSKFAGVLGTQIQPGRRYATELADYAKTMGVKGLFHSDELPNYGITQTQKEAIYKELDCDPQQDGFIIIADTKETAAVSLKVALQRAEKFYLEKEVRMARPDGTSQYMRPMPGAARMYPETDVQALPLDPQSVVVPTLLSEKIEHLVNKYSLAPDVAQQLLRDNIDFEHLVQTYPSLKPAFIVDLFYSYPQHIAKKHDVQVDIHNIVPTILEYLDAQLITKGSIEEIMTRLARGEHIDYKEYKPLSLDDIKDDIKKTVDSMAGAPQGAIIGKIMGKYKGKIDGKQLSQYVQTLLS